MKTKIKINKKHIVIIHVAEFNTIIELSGIRINLISPYTHYDINLTPAAYFFVEDKDGILDFMLPNREIYCVGNVSNNNAYGYVTHGSTPITITEQVCLNNPPENFHPEIKLEIDNGFFKITKMNGSFEK